MSRVNGFDNVVVSYLALGELTDTVVDRIMYDYEIANDGKKIEKDDLVNFIFKKFMPVLELSIDERYSYEENE